MRRSIQPFIFLIIASKAADDATDGRLGRPGGCGGGADADADADADAAAGSRPSQTLSTILDIASLILGSFKRLSRCVNCSTDSRRVLMQSSNAPSTVFTCCKLLNHAKNPPGNIRSICSIFCVIFRSSRHSLNKNSTSLLFFFSSLF